MEKLIKLLNEYEAKRHKTSVVADIREQKEDNLSYLGMNWNYSELLCISKGYGFIERLLENDKIKWRDKTELYYNISCYDCDRGEYELIGPNFTDTEQLIMILSIQDNPLEYLCSILKE